MSFTNNLPAIFQEYDQLYSASSVLPSPLDKILFGHNGILSNERKQLRGTLQKIRESKSGKPVKADLFSPEGVYCSRYLLEDSPVYFFVEVLKDKSSLIFHHYEKKEEEDRFYTTYCSYRPRKCKYAFIASKIGNSETEKSRFSVYQNSENSGEDGNVCALKNGFIVDEDLENVYKILRVTEAKPLTVENEPQYFFALFDSLKKKIPGHWLDFLKDTKNLLTIPEKPSGLEKPSSNQHVHSDKCSEGGCNPGRSLPLGSKITVQDKNGNPVEISTVEDSEDSDPVEDPNEVEISTGETEIL